jgi:hypothetical protein
MELGILSIIFAHLKSIPDVIWSGVIASLLTLGGVLLSNRDNTRRLLIQLQHDADQKAKDRINVMRRDTYLDTVEQLTKVNSYLAGLPQRDVSKENVADGLQAFFTSVAKLQLVAEPQTALLVLKFQADYGELIFDLMRHLIPTIEAKTDIQINDDHYQKTQREISRILSEMSRQNESGKPNSDVFGVLQKSFDFQQSLSSKYAEDRSQARQRFNASSITFQRFLLKRMRELYPKQVPVLMAIRRDLGLTDELADFQKEMELQSKRLEGKFDELLASLTAS